MDAAVSIVNGVYYCDGVDVVFYCKSGIHATGLHETNWCLPVGLFSLCDGEQKHKSNFNSQCTGSLDKPDCSRNANRAE